jgi:hypothetical protein
MAFPSASTAYSHHNDLYCWHFHQHCVPDHIAISTKMRNASSLHGSLLSLDTHQNHSSLFGRGIVGFSYHDLKLPSLYPSAIPKLSPHSRYWLLQPLPHLSEPVLSFGAARVAQKQKKLTLGRALLSAQVCLNSFAPLHFIFIHLFISVQRV